MTPTQRASFSATRRLQQLRERKLIQWALAYAAGAWLILQVIDTLGARWGVTEGIARAVDLLLVVGFVATLVIAWYHGEQGRQRVSGMELLILATLLLIAGVGLRLVRVDGAEPAPAPAREPVPQRAAEAPPAERLRTIAVLPFDNYSPNPDDAYFAAGITEEITGQLARIGDLTVLSRVAVERAVESEASLEGVARALGAGSVLEGSVRMAGDRVRITAQLIEVSTQKHLWSSNFDRELDDIFQIQTDVALAIGDALLAQLSSGERQRIQKPPTRDLRAYQLYLKQQGLAGNIPEQNQAAIALLEQALALDPGFAEARARLAWHHVWTTRLTGDIAQAERARELALQALEQDPELAGGYYALGSAMGELGRTDERREAFERAYELDPSHLPTLLDGSLLRAESGQPASALEMAFQAVRLDPNSPNTRWHAVLPLLALGATERATAWLQLARNEGMRSHRLAVAEAVVALMRGEVSRARELARGAALRFSDHPETADMSRELLFTSGAWQEVSETILAEGRERPERWSTLLVPRSQRSLMAFVLAEQGREEAAMQAFDQALAAVDVAVASGSPWQGSWVEAAAIHAYLGRHEATLEALERAFELGVTVDFALRTDPMFASLGGDPRFADLLQRMADFKRAQRVLAERSEALRGYDELIAAGPAR